MRFSLCTSCFGGQSVTRMALALLFLLHALGSSFVHFPIKTYLDHFNTGPGNAQGVNGGSGPRGDPMMAKEQLHIMRNVLLFKMKMMMMKDMMKVLKKDQVKTKARGVQQPISRLNMFMVRAKKLNEQTILNEYSVSGTFLEHASNPLPEKGHPYQQLIKSF